MLPPLERIRVESDPNLLWNEFHKSMYSQHDFNIQIRHQPTSAHTRRGHVQDQNMVWPSSRFRHTQISTRNTTVLEIYLPSPSSWTFSTSRTPSRRRFEGGWKSSESPSLSGGPLRRTPQWIWNTACKHTHRDIRGNPAHDTGRECSEQSCT